MTKLHNFPIRGKSKIVTSAKRSLTYLRGNSLDTLAQGGTTRPAGNNPHHSDRDCPDAFHIEAVTSVNDREALRKRARRKYLTAGYIGALVDAAKLNGNEALAKSYWNTYHCARTLTLKSDGNVSGRYCKNRWCLVCNAIRTAQLIKRYTPELEAWQDRYLVTLTIPNVEAEQLPAALEILNSMFSEIRDRLKKRAQRGQAEKFKGLRKMECTYNPERNDFHPHFHVLVEGRENAAALLQCWKESWRKERWQADGLACSTSYAATFGDITDTAQDIRPADQGAMLELFKYFTKVIQGSGKQHRLIYADAMDVIFRACKGRQVFKPFGFKAPPAEELTPEEKEQAQGEAYAQMEYEWNQETSRWEANVEAVDLETGEVVEELQPLVDYQPGDALRDLIDTKVVVRVGHSWKRYARPVLILQQGGQPMDEAEQRAILRWLADGQNVMNERRANERARNAQQIEML